MKVMLVFIIIILFFSVSQIGGDSLPEYEPYEDDEFPQWAKTLRRGEIIFFGTIPFTFFVSSFSFEMYKYASNNFDSAFAPALFGNNTPQVKTKDEKLQIILISVSLATVLALIDYLLGKPWNG